MMPLPGFSLSRCLQIDPGWSQRSTIAACRRSETSIRYSVSRRELLYLFLATVGWPSPTEAVCGEPDPYFAHFTEWREGISKLPDGRSVHFRLVGSRKNEKKTKKYPVVYIGDAGTGLSSGETLELLGGDRRVLLTDILGVGDSQPPVDPTASSRSELIEQACEEVRSTMKSAGFSSDTQVHIIAAGFGIEVAEALTQILSEDGMGVLSIVAEGWGSLQDDISLEQLLGERVCAIEAAEAGNLDLARRVYKEGREKGVTSEAIKRLSERFPTVGLRTADYRTVELKGVGPKYIEKVIKGKERLAHLTRSDEFLSLLDDFFVEVEGGK